ncbi:hypothetical protein [Bradyrhizobium sp. 2S1]|uniref:hypothetical protein n=1 Tax=Bradyrhizobium sp. 2S1 TaxID=1404429 RepID=UPI0014080CDE|nr:hypothetical protein [Bradyrhizobium sp. 2S1]MCK7673436.1 hypothetical protein [Bradyrhizobium sp. 2S1]
MAFKITGLDKLQRELAAASKALEALDGQLTEVQYNPESPSSVEAAIAQAEAAIDLKIGPLAFAVRAPLHSFISVIHHCFGISVVR